MYDVRGNTIVSLLETIQKNVDVRTCTQINLETPLHGHVLGYYCIECLRHLKGILIV